MCGLLGVTDIKFDVISALQREKIFLGSGHFLRGGNGAWHGILPLVDQIKV